VCQWVVFKVAGKSMPGRHDVVRTKLPITVMFCLVQQGAAYRVGGRGTVCLTAGQGMHLRWELIMSGHQGGVQRILMYTNLLPHNAQLILAWLDLVINPCLVEALHSHRVPG
jgi:hypothetical protein